VFLIYLKKGKIRKEDGHFFSQTNDHFVDNYFEKWVDLDINYYY